MVQGAASRKETMQKATPHKWAFRTRLRSQSFGWKGSQLACLRLKEAVAEIRKVAKSDPLLAAEGAVLLMERLWPALQQVDSSSGSLGAAVWNTLEALLPIVIAAPAERAQRDAWLERLFAAIEEDGVDYLSLVQDRWGELCATAEVATQWTERLLPSVLFAWKQPRGARYSRYESMCASCLLAARRYQDLFDLLAKQPCSSWWMRRFGVRALQAQGLLEQAIAYAEASRGLNEPDAAIDRACEELLLSVGRTEEAYTRYALTANEGMTGLATFRALVKKYPGVNKRRILLDLAERRGDPGRWFAAAKDSGFLDLALAFATSGKTDPMTLSRACRDFLEKDTAFSCAVGRLSVERILQGYGFELTSFDLMDAVKRYLTAADWLGQGEEVRLELQAMRASEANRAIIMRYVTRTLPN
jgi:hypothetical protein